MKFTLEANAGAHLIRGYSGEAIRIGEQIVRSSCIVTADQLITEWEPVPGAEQTDAVWHRRLPTVLQRLSAAPSLEELTGVIDTHLLPSMIERVAELSRCW